MTSLELVQGLYDAFGRGDIPNILSKIAPDCLWINAGTGIPSAGTYHGPAGVADFFQKMAESEDITHFEVREYFANGDSVVALGTEQARSKLTAKAASTNWAMLFRVKDGLVVHYESYYDTSAYLVAHRA